MTIAVCYHSNEGVILGTDSAATYIPINLVGTSIAIRQFNHAQKIYEIGNNLSIGPIAVAAYGLGEFDTISHRTIAADFADELASSPPTSMDEVAALWSKKVWSVFSTAYLKLKTRLNDLNIVPVRTAAEDEERSRLLQIGGGHFIAGRLATEHTTHAYDSSYNLAQLDAIAPTQIIPGQMATRGCTRVVLRLVKGYDPQIVENLMASNKWNGTRDELMAAMNADDIFPASILNIRDAVDFTYSMIYSTIKGFRFSQSAPLCGGPIEIAAITTDRPFRWVLHKNLAVAVSMALYNET